MSRVDFAAVLKWSPEDEHRTRFPYLGPRKDHGRFAAPKRPAPWPEIMLAQRIAFQHGPAEAYQRVFGDGRKVAA